MLASTIRVNSPSVSYTDDYITSDFQYETTEVAVNNGQAEVVPVSRKYVFRTARKVPKLGVMIVGFGGNNGTTVTAGCLANKLGLTWHTKEGKHVADYFGSLTQATTVRLGSANGEDVLIPFKRLLPMVEPNDIVLGGWDISSANLAQGMQRAAVLDYDLQRQLVEHMKKFVPLPSIYIPDFIAANQADRADNVLQGSIQSQMDQVRKQIKDFRRLNSVDKVIVLWSATTERISDVVEGIHDTADNLLAAIKRGEREVSPSVLFAVASILEGCPFINGSPQNTLIPAVMDLAMRHNVIVGGDDFKSGQTKFKSVLVDFLVQAGMKPMSIVSYNHLGNNDGRNLSAPLQFRSKEVSKSNVVDDMVASNPILYKPKEHPDHVVVIKYVPYVGDSKRAMDEYTSEIFMGGKSTIVVHNTCEDSLLASPLILDLVIIAELFERISYKTDGMDDFENFHPVLSMLSYMLKAPMVPPGTPVVNALFKQRASLENVLRACTGLPVENHMLLEHKCIPASQRVQPAAVMEITPQPVALKSKVNGTAATGNGYHHANGFMPSEKTNGFANHVPQ